jgi:2-keto-4-pentenoate hydratase/2-oxohepta-3-ene-1,7-dioic acid hydratase in catechol pathway
MFGIGHNYMEHIRETGATPPDKPVVFAKFPNAINGPYDDVLIDEAVTSKVDYEVELAVVIGQPARAVSLDSALEHVYGFAVANDVSARDLQKQQPQFSVSKSCDTFCPIGPWITTADEINDPRDLRLRSIVNGDTRQDSNTSDMIFAVAQLVEYLALGMTLKPGDVILSGTPQGVGFAMKPPQRLLDGDVVRCEVQNLGAIENTFRTR